MIVPNVVSLGLGAVDAAPDARESEFREEVVRLRDRLRLDLAVPIDPHNDVPVVPSAARHAPADFKTVPAAQREHRQAINTGVPYQVSLVNNGGAFSNYTAGVPGSPGRAHPCR